MEENVDLSPHDEILPPVWLKTGERQRQQHHCSIGARRRRWRCEAHGVAEEKNWGFVGEAENKIRHDAVLTCTRCLVGA